VENFCAYYTGYNCAVIGRDHAWRIATLYKNKFY